MRLKKITRNTWAMKEYKKNFGYMCMNPECHFGFNPETHHIIPISKGGNDDEGNYIVLCWPCHHKAKRHSRSEEFEVILATWKYYYESLFQSASEGNEIAKEKLKILENGQERFNFRQGFTPKMGQVLY